MVAHIAKFENLVYRMVQMSIASDETSQVVKLLDTLPDSFEDLRQAWWARQETQQTITNLVKLLTSDEQRRQHLQQQNDGMVALGAATAAKVKEEVSPKDAAEQYLKSGKKRGRGLCCLKCNGFGHVSKNCTTPGRKSNANEKSKRAVTEALNAEVLRAENECDMWVLDSGASYHISRHREWFVDYKLSNTPIKVHLGDNKTTMDAIGAGRTD